MVTSILRLPHVCKACGRSRSSLYVDIKNGLFPKPVVIGLRAVGWADYEVDAINKARIAGKNDYAIRLLVIQLETTRKGLPEKECE